MKFTSGLFFIVLTVLTASFYVAQSVMAANPTWLQGNITGEVIPGPGSSVCTQQNVRIGSPTSTEQGEVCVYKAKHFRYGIYTPSSGAPAFVISFEQDRAMYKVPQIPATLPLIHVADSDHLLVNTATQTVGYHLKIIQTIPSKLEQIITNGITTYKLKDNSFQTFLPNDEGGYTLTGSASASENGKWMVIELIPGGFLRINTENNQKLWFSKSSRSYGPGSQPSYDYAISNDGRFVVVSGKGTSPRIYDITGCGRPITVFQEAWRNASQYQNENINECQEKGISNTVQSVAGGTLIYTSKPTLSDDAGELTLQATSIYQPNPAYQEKWIKLTAPNYTPSPRLDYLAMGDSYSSGEGDIERMAGGRKYYLPGTDVAGDSSHEIPEEKCHISSRSYPFKLMLNMQLPSQKAKSVACSGALVEDVENKDPDNYFGQGSSPRLEMFINNPVKLDQYRNQAKAGYVPGRIQQMQFVERNMPKVITLTAGGNDINFEKKLINCILGSPLTNCSLTTDQGRAALGQEIKLQYPKLKKLYEQIKSKSSTSKIYILGYPQFVSNQFNNCAENFPLSPNERTAVFEAVKYLNQVIKAAANDAGVKYVHIEDSLNGHKLCEFGESFMTGISSASPLTEEQELFHPNAKGHDAIYKKIKEGIGSQTLLNTTACNAIIVCPSGTVVSPRYLSIFQK